MTTRFKHPFDTDLEILSVKPHIFEINLTDRWSINDTPNGGYVMAVIVNAMIASGEKKTTPIITANYISRCLPGKAQIQIELVSQTSNLTRMMARLTQDGKEKVRVMGTFSSRVNENAPVEYDGGPPELVPFESAIQLPAMKRYSLFDQVEIRLDPSCVRWMSGQYSHPMRFKGWIGFKDKRKMDIPSILLFSDSFPPPVFVAHGPKAWVPTIELSVNVRKIPDANLLMGVFRTRFISQGLVEEDGELWDQQGNLVAVSRQYSLYKQQ